MPELVIGTVPRGEDYFGQEQLVETLWDYLRKDNVLLLAPRRFGKTGAMYRLVDEPKNGFIPIYIDAEYFESAADFMVELIAKLIKKNYFLKFIKSIWEESKEFGKFIRDLPSEIDFGGLRVAIREKTDVTEKWRDYAERLGKIFSKEGQPLLLIIDEFPIMVGSILQRDKEEARQFLRWFRSVRLARETNTRFVLGGSTNLHSTLDHYGLIDTINDIAAVKINPFSTETAREFIKAIFKQRDCELNEEVSDIILELIGIPIPYLLSVLLQAIFNRVRVTKLTVTPGIVKEAFDEDLLGGSTSATFSHYRTRLDRLQYYSEDERRAAKTILANLSRSEKPIKRNTLYHTFLDVCNLKESVDNLEAFMHLMNKLDNDFYLTADDESYTFYSRVLKMWWKANWAY